MRNKIKKATTITVLALVILSLSGLGLAKYLGLLPDIHTKLFVSSLTLLFTQVCTYLEPAEYLTVAEVICIPSLILLLIITRASMIRRFSC